MNHVALIGFGYFGPNIFRVLTQFEEIKTITVCDISADNLKKIPKVHDNITLVITQDYNIVLGDSEIKTVFIATPGNTHFDLTKKALEKGKNVFVEKPIAFTVNEVEELIQIAGQQGLLLHVDHTFVYSSEINFLKQCLQFDVLGEPISYRSIRANLGPFLNNIDVIYDLAVHDLAVIRYLFPTKTIQKVSAVAHRNICSKYDDADINLFGVNFSAHIHVSWFYPKKVREIITGGTKAMFHHDSATVLPPRIVDLKGKILTYEHITNLGEPLYVEINHFFECLKNDKKTLSTGTDASYVVEILEAIHKSIEKSGETVYI